MPFELPKWAIEMAWVSDHDVALPSVVEGVNVVLNRVRLAAFLTDFAEDRDVRDLLALDALGAASGLPLSSTGEPESIPLLTLRPFRIWEYAWLYKCLGLSAGGAKVLDLGGPASHLSVLSAIAGCRVTSLDINPVFVQAAKECARGLDLDLLDARVGDMRDLSVFPDDHFDIVMSSSVLEHLTANDQETALREMARVLKPGGTVGLTFDFGNGAPGANEHLPPPHAPPPDAREALRRYLQGSLVQLGNPFSEDPIPGSLFRNATISYSVASLFLGKPPISAIQNPRCETGDSALRHLTIRDFPYRIYKYVTGTINHQQGDAAVLEQAATDRDREIGIREQRIAGLEAVAAERLAAMEDRDREIGIREQRIAEFAVIAAERLAAMQDRDREIGIREQRIAEFASIAAERLVAMQDRDREIEIREQRIAGLEAVAAERLAAMQELDREVEIREERSAAPESVAAERLAAMGGRDREIGTREQRIAALEAVAAERLAGMGDRDREVEIREQRIAALEAVAAERLAAMGDRDREIGIREQRIAALEAVAAERLAAMGDRDREVEIREQRIARLKSMVTRPLAAMLDGDREVGIREQRIANLESIAAERLAAMQDRDREIEIREERSARLESIAAERLTAMQDRDREIGSASTASPASSPLPPSA